MLFYCVGNGENLSADKEVFMAEQEKKMSVAQMREIFKASEIHP